ncbi:MAG TPA: hypothetical protein VLC10_03450 [Patescibacteria group bacterium]|nr:hypothetical protein [Patescibacteria group bacterium]
MSDRVKMRLLLVVGVLLIAGTVFVISYGTKRSAELRGVDTGRQGQLVGDPANAAFGEPFSLSLPMNGDVLTDASVARFPDGVVFTLADIDDRKCGGAPVCPIDQLSAKVVLAGGAVAEREELVLDTAKREGDAGNRYHVRLEKLDYLDATFVVTRR